jgi:hypothetical protein
MAAQSRTALAKRRADTGQRRRPALKRALPPPRHRLRAHPYAHGTFVVSPTHLAEIRSVYRPEYLAMRKIASSMYR